MLGGALVLTAGAVSHADETRAPTGAKASSISVKAPARSKRPAKAFHGGWDLTVSEKPEAASRPYTAGVGRQHIQYLSLDLTALLAASIYLGIDQ